jgi:uncharacterized protein YprB with RNaseH-like and TPR domain
MLRKTFLHVPGIGEKSERKLWAAGCTGWEQALEREDWLPPRLRQGVMTGAIEESMQQYAQGRWQYFDARLPATAKWRALPDLHEQVLYVDIETNGYDNDITVIGVYDGVRFRAFVADRDLDEAREVLEQAALVVTYNGTGFDLPILRDRFRHALFNHVHLDLMWPLRRMGLRGGLKKIERQLGLCRSDETEGLTGWDAVWLWREHQRGSTEALKRLIAYNEEDVRNLEPLARYVVREMTMRCGCPVGH